MRSPGNLKHLLFSSNYIRLVKISVEQELKWLFPDYNPVGFSSSNNNNNNAPAKILVAGCGSGQEVCQLHAVFENVDVTAFDISSRNIAYAIRQHRELKMDQGSHFYVADLMGLRDTKQLGLESKGERFDVIYARNILQHLDDPVKGMRSEP